MFTDPTVLYSGASALLEPVASAAGAGQVLVSDACPTPFSRVQQVGSRSLYRVLPFVQGAEDASRDNVGRNLAAASRMAMTLSHSTSSKGIGETSRRLARLDWLSPLSATTPDDYTGARPCGLYTVFIVPTGLDVAAYGPGFATALGYMQYFLQNPYTLTGFGNGQT